MDEIEILKARVEMQVARIAELEKQNKEYLDRIDFLDDTIDTLNRMLDNALND